METISSYECVTTLLVIVLVILLGPVYDLGKKQGRIDCGKEG